MNRGLGGQLTGRKVRVCGAPAALFLAAVQATAWVVRYTTIDTMYDCAACPYILNPKPSIPTFSYLYVLQARLIQRVALLSVRCQRSP